MRPSPEEWPVDSVSLGMSLDVHEERTELGWDEEGLGHRLGASTSALGRDPTNVGGEPRRAYGEG